MSVEGAATEDGREPASAPHIGSNTHRTLLLLYYLLLVRGFGREAAHQYRLSHSPTLVCPVMSSRSGTPRLEGPSPFCDAGTPAAS